MTFEEIIKKKNLEIVKAVCKEIVKLTPEFFSVENLGLRVSVKNRGILSMWCDKYRDFYRTLYNKLQDVAMIDFDWNSKFYNDVQDMLYEKCEQLGLFSNDIMQSKDIVVSTDDKVILDKLIKDDTLHIPDSCTNFTLHRADVEHNVRKISGGKSLKELVMDYDYNYAIDHISLDLSSSPDFKLLVDKACIIESITPCKDQKHYYSLFQPYYTIEFTEQPRLVDDAYIKKTANNFLTIDKNFRMNMKNSYTLPELLLLIQYSSVHRIYVEGSKDFLIDILKKYCPGYKDSTIKRYITKIENNYNVQYNQTRYK